MNTDNDTEQPLSRKYPLLLALLGAFLLSCVLLFLPPGAQKRITAFGRLFTSPALSFSHLCLRTSRAALGGLELDSTEDALDSNPAEQKRLQLELDKLRTATATLRKDNQLLKTRLGMIENTHNLSLALCEVRARDAISSYYDFLVINRGRNDGIKPGFPVFNEAGLVGIIAESSSDSAKVLLATSHAFALPCQVRIRGVNGLLTGHGTDSSQLTMSQPVPQIVVNNLDGILFDKIKTGDKVTVNATAAPDAPPILVGTVDKIEENLSGAPVLILRPAATFQHLRFLFVALDSTPKDNGK